MTILPPVSVLITAGIKALRLLKKKELGELLFWRRKAAFSAGRRFASEGGRRLTGGRFYRINEEKKSRRQEENRQNILSFFYVES